MKDRINLGIENLQVGDTRPVEIGANIVLRANPGGERDAAVCSFVREGLERGEAVVAVISTPISDFLTRLGGLGIDVQGVLDEKQLCIVDWERFHRKTVRGVEEVDGVFASSVDLANVRIALGMALDSAGAERTRILVDIVDAAASIYSEEELTEHLTPLISKLEGSTSLMVISEAPETEDLIASFARLFDGILILAKVKEGIAASLVSLSPMVNDVPEKNVHISNTGLIAERSDLACTICGAWVDPETTTCSTCGADMETSPPEEVLQKMEPGHVPSLYLCPFCGAFLQKDALRCGICGAEFLEEAEGSGVFLEEEELYPVESQLPSGDADGAEAALDLAGFLGMRGKDIQKMEPGHVPSLYLCPSCGAFLQKDALRCGICGAEFLEEAEGSGVFLEEEELYPVESQLPSGDADGAEAALDLGGFQEEEEKPAHHDLYLCPFCGAIISEWATSCLMCGSIIEPGSLRFLAVDKEAALICPQCGAYLIRGAEACPICNTVLLEEDGEEWDEMYEIIAMASLEELLASTKKIGPLEQKALSPLATVLLMGVGVPMGLLMVLGWLMGVGVLMGLLMVLGWLMGVGVLMGLLMVLGWLMGVGVLMGLLMGWGSSTVMD